MIIIFGEVFRKKIMENCNCKTEGFTDYICVICKQSETHPMSEIDLKAQCKIHRIIMMCGRPEFVCKPCEEAGWYSTAGWGGGTQHLNSKTGEEKPVERLRGKPF